MLDLFRTIKTILLRTVLVGLLQEAGDMTYRHRSLPNLAYDFIIVGSGSAGSVLGARLSEVADWDILVLESGDVAPPESYVPGLDLLLLRTKSDWGYQTTPQKYSQFGYINNASPFPRGHVLGGSSAINFMMYVRGNKKDFDYWASQGNPGWSYKEVLPYFKKSEDYQGIMTTEALKYHGKGGPLTVSNKKWGSPLEAAYLEAGEELGYSRVDANAGQQTGFMSLDVTIKNGVRMSAATAFLRPNLQRPNLHVITNAHVTKIIFDKNKRAVGVNYRLRGQEQFVRARREVILSAGAIASPQLLMLSGVGPKGHLRKHKIPVVADVSGVGQNLVDHPSVFSLTWTIDSNNGLTMKDLMDLENWKKFIFERNGVLATPFGAEGNAWIQRHEKQPDWPDLQFLLFASTPAIDSGLLFNSLIGFDEKIFQEYFSPIFGKDGFAIGPMLTRPYSRGQVTLKSTDPMDHPNIDPNFFSNQSDVELMVEGIKFALQIGNTTAMKKLGARFYDQSLPICRSYTTGSDDYWRCYVRSMSSSTFHPASTCKMGPLSDPSAVVDPRLRVRGVKNIRVTDASIMPQITTGNLHAPVVMIGEKAADIIKEDWGESL